MKISDLKIYTCAAHHLSFTKAAMHLNMTQPGVSRTIKNIECQLETELFERSGKKLTLTPSGEIFLQSSKSILKQYQSTISQLKSYNQELDGKIVLRCLSIVMGLLSKDFFPDFLEKYPNIQIEHDNLIDQEPADYNEICISMDKPNDQQTVAHRIFTCQYNYYASESYISKYGHPEHAEEFIHHNCLLGSRPWLYRENNEIKQIPLKKQIRSSSEKVVETLCIKGVGIAQLPVFFVNHHLKGCNLVPLLEQEPDLAINLFAVYKKQKVQQYRKKLLIKEISSFFEKIECEQFTRMT